MARPKDGGCGIVSTRGVVGAAQEQRLQREGGGRGQVQRMFHGSGGFQLGLKDEARRDYGEKGNGGQGREQVKSSGRGWRGGERGWRKVGSLVLSPAGVSAGCRGQGVHRAEAGADRTAGSALTPGGGGRGRQELPAWYRGVWCPLLDPLKKLAAPRSLLCAEPPLPKRLVRS